MRAVVLLVSCLVVWGCSDDRAATPVGVPGGAGGQGGVGTGGAGGGSSLSCNSAAGDLGAGAGVTVIQYDDGEASSHLRAESWSITVGANTYVLGEQVLNEAVRFELEHPARILGFEVMWAGLDEPLAPEMPLVAGLFPDFGYNGFDFWPEPLWTGSRCAADVAPGQWLSYALAEPVEVDHPGLVYVAHRAEPPAGPLFWFDGNVEGEGDPCTGFDQCQSAINLPEAETAAYFNGLSFPFQYHYLVRLHVEYTDDLRADERFFQPVAGVPADQHVSWGDYDDDGWDDLLLGGRRLLRNQGDGSFADATDSSGIAVMALQTTGGVWGDYDNDGCLDLFLFAESYTEPDALLRANCDGTFTDVTAASGIVDQQSYNDCGDPANVRSPSAAAAWLDIDGDGLLDLYVANFICWGYETFYLDTVFHNEGDGTFADWTGQHGFSATPSPSRGASPIDHDGDGDVDLFVNNYRLKANRFFENEGDGTVTERAYALGLAGQGVASYYGHTIGAAWGDLNGDGFFDMVHANLAHPRFFDFSDKTQILLNDGTGHYADISGTWSQPASDAGLRYQETHSVPVVADFDQDGRLDLVITCVYDGRPTDFYWGNGDGTFELDSYHAGIGTEDGWGAAAADYDHDGDPDLFATTLFENRWASPGHFLQVRAIGNLTSNWAAIGATVAVTADGQTRLRHVQGGTGKGGQDSLFLHFGLGTASEVTEVSVRFPGGADVVLAGPIQADQRLWVYEDGTMHAGWSPP